MSETSPHPHSGAGDERPGILLYGMYDLRRLDRAPEVRIAAMTEALGRQARVERITGGRLGRAWNSTLWLLRGGPRRVRAVYVESPTASAMPTDLLFLALMRLFRRPVGVYFRDAYQLFRDIYPRRRRLQIVSDWLWRVTSPALARLATRRFAASAGLARVLKLRDGIPLGPGGDPSLPDLGAGPEPLVAYVGATGSADGFDILLAAMEIVHGRLPDSRLLVVSPGSPPAGEPPPYVELRRGRRDALPELLRDARLCVIPRPINPYSDLAVPVKLWDYLSLGKPVVATAAAETAAILAAGGSGIATPDTPEGLAEGLLSLLADRDLAGRLAKGARAYACSAAQTWEARATTVVRELGLQPAAAVVEPEPGR
jgi:glycosyltransferase involved in cell wall biosynthesis